MIVELSGGLGNQLFEYAAARYVQLQNGEPMTFNLYPFLRDPQRDYSLGHFALDEEVSKLSGFRSWLLGNWSEVLCHLYHRKGLTRGAESFQILSRKGLLLTFDVYCFYAIDPSKKGYYWKGNFQSEKYFPGMKDTLRKDFTLKEALPEKTKKLMEEMKGCDSVCVHVRRGDYVTNPVDHQILDICGKAYYEKAMAYVTEQMANPVFYIFSNTREDLDWIRENYRFQGDVRYVDLEQPDYMELKTMSACKHFIISNSTFSWWAQYLADCESKVVVAPSIWYNGEAQDASDIYQDEWHIIDVNEDLA